jgi:glutamate synthase domain-containing protein 3
MAPIDGSAVDPIPQGMASLQRGHRDGAVGNKHLPAYLDEHVFRFNRRAAKRISHGFARLIEQAVQIIPTTYRDIVGSPA